MRPSAPFSLHDPVQVSNHNFSSSTGATYGFCVIAHGLFIHHITMPQQAVANLAPTVLEIIVNYLAAHTSGLIGDLAHHTAR
jgi:hypothetical protein